MAPNRFSHLCVHSGHSLKEGSLHVKKLPGLCEALDFPALVAADTNSLFGALESSDCCTRDQCGADAAALSAGGVATQR